MQIYSGKNWIFFANSYRPACPIYVELESTVIAHVPINEEPIRDDAILSIVNQLSVVEIVFLRL